MNLLIKSQGISGEKPEEYGNSELSAAPGAAFGAENKHTQPAAGDGIERKELAAADACDPDLAEVVDRWGTLPEAVRLAVMAVVRSASK
jgi:hypothetical protein